MNFELKQTYSFEVYPAALLGNGFKNVVVMAILDYESANQIIDTQALHVQVKPSLPPASPSRASDYNYLKIRMPNGDTTVIGLPWIKENTIQQITSTTVHAVISGVTPADVPRIRAALLQNGYPNLEITVQ